MALVPDTSDAISPAETFAVVVGVERYAAGDRWDLDGPAADAARFAGWLRGRGVPASNIALLVSPLEKNRGLAWPEGCAPAPATHANLMPLLHGTLRERRERLLVFFWGGHGVMHGAETRRLFFPEATREHRANLDLNGVLGLLRGDQLRAEAWPKQIFITDACASLAERDGWAEKLPTETYAAGDGVVLREQFALFAAQPGESAANLNAAQTGLFSRELLGALGERPAGEWPPDMEAISQVLIQRFIALREQGLARQTPAYLWVRDWKKQAERAFGAFSPARRPGAAAAPLLSPQDLGELLDALLACPSLRRHESREDARLSLRPAIAHAVAYRPDDRGHVLNILKACIGQPGGLAELVHVLRLEQGADAAEVQELEQTLRRVVPGALPPDP